MVRVNLSGRTFPDKSNSLHLKSADRARDFTDQLADIGRIDLEFPAFGDGRAFTLARRLREQMNFTGEIRAVGHVLPDQAAFLLRCGFDSAEFKTGPLAEEAKLALKRFSVRYQPALDGTGTAAGHRLAAGNLRRRVS